MAEHEETPARGGANGKSKGFLARLWASGWTKVFAFVFALVALYFRSCVDPPVSAEVAGEGLTIDAPAVSKDLDLVRERYSVVWISKFATDTLQNSMTAECRLAIQSPTPPVDCLRRLEEAFRTIHRGETEELVRVQTLEKELAGRIAAKQAAISRDSSSASSPLDPSDPVRGARLLLVEPFYLGDGSDPAGLARVREYAALVRFVADNAESGADETANVLASTRRSTVVLVVGNPMHDPLDQIRILVNGDTSGAAVHPVRCDDETPAPLTVPALSTRKFCFLSDDLKPKDAGEVESRPTALKNCKGAIVKLVGSYGPQKLSIFTAETPLCIPPYQP